MSRRTDNSPAISFFSFQDIITSVTGIMFLVVLILILMLVMRQDYTPEQRAEDNHLAQLKAELERLQEQLDASVKSSDEIARQMKALEALKLEELPVRIQKVGDELVKLEAETQKLTVDEQKKMQQLEMLKRQQQELDEKLKKVATQQTENDTVIADWNAKNAESKKKLQAAKRTMRFTWKKSFQKQPLLVECGAKEIEVGLATDVVSKAVFKGDTDEKTVKKFMKWLNGYDRKQYYVLLLVKPGAFEYAESLSQLLQSKGYDRGREVLPDDETRIFQGGEK